MTKVFVIGMAFLCMGLPGVSAAGSFKDNGNGTVTDLKTNLIWQKCSAGLRGTTCATGAAAADTWENAISYCEGLSLGGHSDWRLPNHKELLSLVDYTRHNPSINTTFFPNEIFSSIYWSSTTTVRSTSVAWSVYFYNGSSLSSIKTDSNYVRCVRGKL